jgi:hypothetical protein
MLYLKEPNSINSPENVIFGHSFDPVVILKLCLISFHHIVDACGYSLDGRELAMLSWDIRRIFFRGSERVGSEAEVVVMKVFFVYILAY